MSNKDIEIEAIDALIEDIKCIQRMLIYQIEDALDDANTFDELLTLKQDLAYNLDKQIVLFKRNENR